MQRLLFCAVVAAASVTGSTQAQAPSGGPAQGRATTQAAPTPPKPATPTTQTPAPAPATPAPAAPRRPAAPSPPARGGVTIIVTDMAGAPLRDIRIQAVGPTERSGTTDGGGQLRITGMPAGTYRLRFSNETVVEFEREVVVRGGPNTEVDVALRPAPPPVVITATTPPPPPSPTPTPVAPIGPVGLPQTLLIPDLVTKSFLEGSRNEVLLSCSANTRTTLVQLSADQSDRLYENADVTYHVIGGEGTVRIGARETALKLDSFVSVPRGTRFAVSRKGRRPLIMVAQLSGEPCEQAK